MAEVHIEKEIQIHLSLTLQEGVYLKSLLQNPSSDYESILTYKMREEIFMELKRGIEEC